MNEGQLRFLVKVAAHNARRRTELKFAIKRACEMRKQAGLGSYLTNGAKSLWSLGKGIGGAALNSMTFGLAGADPTKHLREAVQHGMNATRGLFGAQARPVGQQPKPKPVQQPQQPQQMQQAQKMQQMQQAQKMQQAGQVRQPVVQQPAAQSVQQPAVGTNSNVRQARRLAKAGM